MFEAGRQSTAGMLQTSRAIQAQMPMTGEEMTMNGTDYRTRRFPPVKLAALALACAMASPAWVHAEETEQETGEQATMQSGSASQSENSGQGALAALAEEEGNLATFAKAVEQAGLTEGIEKGTYTIFAPTDDAFEASGKDLEELLKPDNRNELVSLLRAHIVADDVDPEMARTIGEARTVDGGTVELTADGDELQIGEASVVTADLQQGDLRVYTIDQVLTPNVSQSMAGSGETPSFDELDQDGDGYLTESEVQGEEALASQQSELDSDGDDQISRSEFAAFEPQGETSENQDESEDSSWFGGEDDDSSN